MPSKKTLRRRNGRCQATNDKGGRCWNAARSEASGYCSVHKDRAVGYEGLDVHIEDFTGGDDE